MFQSRITCKQYYKYMDLLQKDPKAAQRFKIQFDRTDQWFLEEVRNSFVAHGKMPIPPFTEDECALQDDIVGGKYSK